MVLVPGTLRLGSRRLPAHETGWHESHRSEILHGPTACSELRTSSCHCMCPRLALLFLSSLRILRNLRFIQGSNLWAPSVLPLARRVSPRLECLRRHAGRFACSVDAVCFESIVQMRATTARQRGKPRWLAEQGSSERGSLQGLPRFRLALCFARTAAGGMVRPRELDGLEKRRIVRLGDYPRLAS